MSLKAIVEYIDNSDNVRKGIRDFVDIAVKKSIKVMERNVKVNTPVKHGHLRRSIRSRMTGFGQGEVYNEAVQGGKEINYAVYMEYGTKYVAPRAMFRKGVGQSEERIQQIFKEEAKRVHDNVIGNGKK